MSPQQEVKLISSVRLIVLTLVKQCGSESGHSNTDKKKKMVSPETKAHPFE